jgi:uncharacterized membrane protein (UPF0127 family)
LLAATVLAAACTTPGGGGSALGTLPRGILQIQTGSRMVSLRVQIAETEPDRQAGLMGVRHLDPDAGMAFLFDGSTTATFWMKDTPIALSIAFWQPDGRIVAILDMTPCHSDPCRQYSGGAPYTGAVEANIGYFRTHDVQLGDVVKLVR